MSTKLALPILAFTLSFIACIGAHFIVVLLSLFAAVRSDQFGTISLTGVLVSAAFALTFSLICEGFKPHSTRRIASVLLDLFAAFAGHLFVFMVQADVVNRGHYGHTWEVSQACLIFGGIVGIVMALGRRMNFASVFLFGIAFGLSWVAVYALAIYSVAGMMPVQQ